MNKIGFVSLGCPKALVDSERIITRLRAENYEVSGSYDDANLVIINTCGFVESAVKESMDAIGEAMAQNGKVIVTGCLGAKKETILKDYPNVLDISGPQDYESVMRAVHTHLPPSADPFTSLLPPQGIKLTPRHYAYLKISEGCNHSCTFCIIPSMRGKLQSRSLDDVMREAIKLRDAGVRELLVISQDTSAYGLDLGKNQFAALCQTMKNLGIWVRLHYIYPYKHVDDIVGLMSEGALLPYLDVPFQHSSSKILKLMKRPASGENNLQRVQAWRKVCPELTVRSTFIVGFPGETEEDFQELLQFLKDAQLDRVGCFKYSAVDGAVANALPGAVSEEVKEERYHRFMQLQAQISAQRLKQKVGRTMQVLIDSVEEGSIAARSSADAPEIDGLVWIKTRKKNLAPGDLLAVKITDSTEYDLIAKPI